MASLLYKFLKYKNILINTVNKNTWQIGILYNIYIQLAKVIYINFWNNIVCRCVCNCGCMCVCAVVEVSAWRCYSCFVLCPVLFDLKGPIPLQMYVLVVIREHRTHRVGSSRYHTRWCLLCRRQIKLNFLLRGIGANHMRHFVHCIRWRLRKVRHSYYISYTTDKSEYLTNNLKQ